jgi:nucleoside-diphosphate-sugar epimerase
MRAGGKLKKILIMGGTGAMGRYLVPMLVEEDSYQVFVTSRSTRQSSLKNLIYLKGNAKNIEWITTILQSFEFDVIFDFMMYGDVYFSNRCKLFL